MPKITDCLKAEREAAANVIRLVRNNNFLRAYNRSAWLFQRVVTEYRVKRQFIKSVGEEVFFIGFPEGCLHQHASGHELTTTELGFDIIVEAGHLPIIDDYEQWKEQIPLSNASQADFDAAPLIGAEAEREVMRRLRTFPLVRKTPMECQQLVSELQELLEKV